MSLRGSWLEIDIGCAIEEVVGIKKSSGIDAGAFLTTARVHMVAGKGGVGKTTVAAVLARTAAAAGRSVLVLEITGDRAAQRILGCPDVDHARTADGRITVRSLRPADVLVDYLEESGFGHLAGPMVRTGITDVISHATPGLRDILVLGRIKQLARTSDADLIVVDAPASGHAITFLRAPEALMSSVDVGAIHTQATEALSMLTDPEQCQVVLVTTPEETPVNELIETAFSLEDEVGVHLGPVVVNGVQPHRPGIEIDPTVAAAAAGVDLDPEAAEELAAAARISLSRRERQSNQIDRLEASLPLPQIVLPRLFRAGLTPPDIDHLAGELNPSESGEDPRSRSATHGARQQ